MTRPIMKEDIKTIKWWMWFILFFIKKTVTMEANRKKTLIYIIITKRFRGITYVVGTEVITGTSLAEEVMRRAKAKR